MPSSTPQLDKLIDLHALPKAQARVEIAKDVLAALQIKKIQAQSGCYFEAKLSEGSQLDEIVELRAGLQNMKQCEVCALGACFVAAIARVNNFTVALCTGWVSDIDAIDLFSSLTEWFSAEQLCLIECAFERQNDSPAAKTAGKHRLNFTDKTERASLFADNIELQRADTLDSLSDNDLLKAIMENIIANNGTFRP